MGKLRLEEEKAEIAQDKGKAGEAQIKDTTGGAQ